MENGVIIELGGVGECLDLLVIVQELQQLYDYLLVLQLYRADDRLFYESVYMLSGLIIGGQKKPCSTERKINHWYDCESILVNIVWINEYKWYYLTMYFL